MPKYEVSMNLVEAKIAKFIVEAKDEDEVYDVVGEIDDWEDILEWNTSDYEPPIIDSVKVVGDRKKINKDIQKRFSDIIKDWDDSSNVM